ncbi:MAG TPA: RNA polymerase factor sigma-54 [Verrucomicrobiota bacterium]|nr:RNA polymerase factor sigma-54 [Verrucomicrobiota bacterium]
MKLTMKTALAQVIAPQLQESLVLLATPVLELKSKVNEELERNPVLEMEERPPAEIGRTAEISSPTTDLPSNSSENHDFDFGPEVSGSADVHGERMERLAEQVESWKEYFLRGDRRTHSAPTVDEEKRQYFFNSIPTEQSLQGYLLEQVALLDITEREREVLILLIGFIDEQGYLRAKPAELVISTNLSPEEIKRGLQLLHENMEPVGVGARDLRQCLLIQLERAGMKDSLEWKIVHGYLEALAGKKYPVIARKNKVTVEEVNEAALNIARLEPKPGRPFYSVSNLYVVPEVFVEEDEDGEYKVTMNDDLLPRLRINPMYKEMIGSSDSKETRSYIQEKIRSGRFFITSLAQRQRTIRKIAEAIVSFQSEFMRIGPKGLIPLTMAKVAEVTGLHETTVGRAVSGKYMQTPQGVFEMRYFFSSKLKSDNPEGVSNIKVKTALAEMIAGEDKSNPLSDQQLVEAFEKKGVQVARRTLAKYRSELGILPSSQRKSF